MIDKGVRSFVVEEIRDSFTKNRKCNFILVKNFNILNLIDAIINPALVNDGIQVFNPKKMTGDDSFLDVRQILNEIETNEDLETCTNLIVATNMISHGVDTDKFNFIFFYGITPFIAEFIQAYSRVGRRSPGMKLSTY